VPQRLTGRHGTYRSDATRTKVIHALNRLSLARP